MKIFRNEICYVLQSDLARTAVPLHVMDEIANIPYIVDDYILIRDPKNIKYIKDRKDILDYDEVSSLSTEELDQLYSKSLDKLNIYAERWLNTPSYLRGNLSKDNEYMETYRYYKYRTNDLLDYKVFKDKIDSNIKDIIDNRSMLLSKKKDIKYKVVL